MKAFELKDEYSPIYPDDFYCLKKYLLDHGKLNISDRLLEDFYEDFSDEEYSAGWMSIINDRNKSINYTLLNEFAHWLSEKEL